MNWKTLLVALVGAVLVGVVAFFGPALGVSPEAHVGLLAALGGAAVWLGSYLAPMFKRDTDGDGRSDGQELLERLFGIEGRLDALNEDVQSMRPAPSGHPLEDRRVP